MREDPHPGPRPQTPPHGEADGDVMAEVQAARRRVFTAWEAARRHARFFADESSERPPDHERRTA